MKSGIEDDLEEEETGHPNHKKLSVCLMTRIAFYGCLALALGTLGIFIVTNLNPK